MFDNAYLVPYSVVFGIQQIAAYTKNLSVTKEQ